MNRTHPCTIHPNISLAQVKRLGIAREQIPSRQETSQLRRAVTCLHMSQQHSRIYTSHSDIHTFKRGTLTIAYGHLSIRETIK